MHPAFSKADKVSNAVIGAAIEVHRDKGPGLLESIYDWCLRCELELRELSTESQRTVPIRYKHYFAQESLRFDLLVEGCVLIETKSVERLLPIHQAQLLSYMKLLDVPVGLLINFNVGRLADGIVRMELREKV